MKAKISLCLVALFFSLSPISARSGEEMSKLDGEWVLDREAMMEMLKLDYVPDITIVFDTNKQEIRQRIEGTERAEKYTIASQSSKEIPDYAPSSASFNNR